MSINIIQNYGSLGQNSTSTLSISGANNISTGYSWVDHSKNIEDIKNFVEFTLEILEIDLKYEDFIKMSNSDKRAFIRNWKLNQILKNKED